MNRPNVFCTVWAQAQAELVISVMTGQIILRYLCYLLFTICNCNARLLPETCMCFSMIVLILSPETCPVNIFHTHLIFQVL